MFKKFTHETWHLPKGHKFHCYMMIVRLPNGRYKLIYCGQEGEEAYVTKSLFSTPEDAFEFVKNYDKTAPKLDL